MYIIFFNLTREAVFTYYVSDASSTDECGVFLGIHFANNEKNN